MFALIAGITTLICLVVYCWWIDDELPTPITKEIALKRTLTETSQPQGVPRQLREHWSHPIYNWPTGRAK